MSNNFITIASYRQAIDAHIAKAKLESEDIECLLMNEDMNWLYAGVVSVNLQVKEEDIKEAIDILQLNKEINES